MQGRTGDCGWGRSLRSRRIPQTKGELFVVFLYNFETGLVQFGDKNIEQILQLRYLMFLRKFLDRSKNTSYCWYLNLIKIDLAIIKNIWLLN